MNYQDIKLAPDGDMDVQSNGNGGKDFTLVKDLDEIEQHLRVLLQTIRGEDIFNPDVGLPIPDMMGPVRELFIEGAIISALFKDPRVVSVHEFTIDVDSATRVATVQFYVTLNTGDILIMEHSVSA